MTQNIPAEDTSPTVKRERVTAPRKIFGFSENHIYLFTSILVFIGSIVYFAYKSYHMGEDVNYDLQNYHFYNGYAAWNGVWLTNLGPAQEQSYFVPTADVFTYLLITHLKPAIYGILLGGFQGLNFGLVYLISIRVIRFKDIFAHIGFSLLCAIVGMAAPISVSELGSSMQDLTLSVPALLGVLLTIAVLQKRETTRTTLAVLAVAGLLLGLTAGMKYTTGAFALGAAIAFLLVTRDKIKNSVTYISAIGAGFIITAGYWMLELYIHFKNPFFPNFNTIFKSPFASPDPLPPPFKITTLSELIFNPFYFRVNSVYTNLEIPYRNLTFALIYVLLVVVLVINFIYIIIYWRRHFGNLWKICETQLKSIPRERLFLLIFFIISYIVWLKLFWIYRYLNTLELLAPVVILILLMLIPWFRYKYVLYALACVLLAFSLFTMQIGGGAWGWGRVAWSSRYFNITPPIISHPAQSVVFMASADPIGYAAAYLPPATRVLNIGDGINAQHFAMQDYIQLEQQMIQKGTYFYLLTPYSDINQNNKVLLTFHFLVIPNSCIQITNVYQANKNTLENIYFCQATHA